MNIFVYLNVIEKLEAESKIILAMNHRIKLCLNKISFSLGFLKKNYSKHLDLIGLCEEMCEKISEQIDISIADKYSSFIELNKK